jgi:hypothetical protein
MKGKPYMQGISEDWWAVIAAFILILLAAAGILGKGGLSILF